MHLRVTRCFDNADAFPWFGAWPEYDDSRFPDLTLCIQGDTPLPQLCYYIAAKWHIDPRCVSFYIGHEDDGFTHEREDAVLADVTLPPDYNEVFVTARLVPTTYAIELPLQWEVHRDEINGVDSLLYRVDRLRCWGCGGNMAKDIAGCATLQCGHTHCAACVDEVRQHARRRGGDGRTRCKHCQREILLLGDDAPMSAALMEWREAVACEYEGCAELATHRCWCGVLVCSTHGERHGREIKGHHGRPIQDPSDTAPWCLHSEACVAGRSTMYCTHQQAHMCLHCMTDARHADCPAGSHVTASSVAAQTLVLRSANEHAIGVVCCRQSTDRIAAYSEDMVRKVCAPDREVPRRDMWLRLLRVPVVADAQAWMAQSPRVDVEPCVDRCGVLDEAAWKASDRGHRWCLETLAAADCNLLAHDVFGQGNAFVAARSGHLDCLHFFRHTVHADLLAPDSCGRTAAHQAAAFGHAECLQMLHAVALEENRNLDFVDEQGRTPAHEAASEGHASCLKILIRVGVNLAVKDRLGRTPAHHSARNGHVGCLQVLHNKEGLDFQATDRQGRTPAHLCALYGHESSLALLRDYGVDLQAKDDAGQTPAHCCVAAGHDACLKLLHASAVDLNAKDGRGWTPAHHACDKGHAACLEILRSADADLGVADEYEQTCVTLAATNGHAVCLELLKDAGVDLQGVDRYGRTAAHYSASNGHAACLQVFASARVDFGLSDKQSRTPAHDACLNDNFECLRVLHTAGADLAAMDKKRRTPAHYAAQSGHLACLRLLQEIGVHLDQEDVDGWTPAHFAATNNHVGCLELLQAAGADTRWMRPLRPRQYVPAPW